MWHVGGGRYYTLFVCLSLFDERSKYIYFKNVNNFGKKEKINIILYFDASQTKAHRYKLDSQIIGCII